MKNYNPWLKEIIKALEKLSGKASLEQINKQIEASSEINLDKYVDWKSQVRKNIYLHSSDADIFKGTPGGDHDIFYSPKKGEGIWGLRSSMSSDNNENIENAIKERDLVLKEQIRSMILKVMNEHIREKRESFGGNQLAQFIRQDLVKKFEELSMIDTSKYIVKASAGQGNWAQVPWLAIMHKDITRTTQDGFYIVYLFSEDMERLYLTLALGITNNTKEEINTIKQGIREKVSIDERTQVDNNLDLGKSSKAIGYRDSVALYIPYEKDTLPDEQQLQQDLTQMIQYYEEYIKKQSNDVIHDPPNKEKVEKSDESIIKHIHNYIEFKGFYFHLDEIKNLFQSLRTKPFVILSGISGTGKTKIIELFAESIGATDENGRFKLIPVRPDWSDGSDVLGYVDIKGDFQSGPLTNVIQKASQDEDNPYFVVLDEMNLARVEYYFSDFLSVMESRKWKDGKIVTSTLLLEEQLGERLTIPANLYIIGTVNMDETTHPFSKKVLDRANTIEFNEVKLDHFSLFENNDEIGPIPLHNERLQSKYLYLKDAYDNHKDLIHDVTERLVELNQLLEPIQTHIGYRVRDEVCFYVIYSRYLMDLDQAFDYQLYQKILPRISASESRAFEALKGIYQFCTNHQFEEETEPDNQQEVIKNAKYPKSTRKVYEMLRRGQTDGFTSFWIG